MTIEFADPGFNMAFFWWPIASLVLAIVAVVVAWPFIEDAAAPILIIPILAMVFVPVIGSGDHGNRVDDLKVASLSEQGFTNVEVTEDFFTAATSDGEYFWGYLLDLEPESGYAYRIVELED